MKSRIQKGFTLIEMILVIGIISLLTLGTYNYYSKKSDQQKLETQVDYLVNLTDDINRFLKPTNNFALLTPANLINSNIIPSEMIDGANIVSLFRTPITFSNITIVNPNDGFRISLSLLPQNVCNNIAVSPLGSKAGIVRVNTNVTKPYGSDITGAVVANAATFCVDGNNTVDFDTVAARENNPIGPGGAYFVTGSPNFRAKENPYYIATVTDTANSPVVACTGGSTWTGSFCSCPNNTTWNGTSCVVFGTVPGYCPLGQGWINNACAPLPSGASVSGSYVSGRTVPNLYAANPTVPQAVTTSETIASCTAPNSFFDGKKCQVCERGSWNGFRCVTP